MATDRLGNAAWQDYCRAELEKAYSNLKETGYRVTSPDTIDYNCVAWAVEGETEEWWWPDAMQQEYWPPSAPREETLEAFIIAFQSIGYEVCDDPELEPGYWKIAIYTDAQAIPTHVARLQADGKWTSKLGQYEDIEHNALAGLTEGTSGYGKVACYMKRLQESEAFG